MEGLGGLTTVGTLEIDSNGALVSLNTALQSVEGLRSLTVVGGYL